MCWINSAARTLEPRKLSLSNLEQPPPDHSTCKKEEPGPKTAHLTTQFLKHSCWQGLWRLFYLTAEFYKWRS